MTLDPTRIVRPLAYTWIIASKIGNAQVAHSFVAARATWVLHRKSSGGMRMKMTEVQLAIAQTVPNGSMNEFCDILYQFEQRIADKKPASQITLCDLNRSHEARELIWQKSPDAVPILTTTAFREDLSFPFWIIGRGLILSKLQVVLSERKLISALPNNIDDDPNFWDWQKTRAALATITGKAPKLDEDDLIGESVLYDDIATCIGLIVWFAETDLPSIYEPLEKDLAEAERKRNKLKSEIARRKDNS